MSLVALQNCIIIEPDVEKHELFIIPPGEKMETGIVKAIGPTCTDITVGDHVYFGVGQEFKYEDTEYVVIRENHVLGVLENG
jgi:co-chaperonin GroES (HSP10)